MHKFDKLLAKKKGGPELSESEQQAKMNVVKNLRDIANDEMSQRLKGYKKVTVASPTKEGLEEGLDKAKEVAGAMPEGEDMEDMEEMHGEGMDSHELAEMSEEEIDAKIAELMKAKMAKKA